MQMEFVSILEVTLDHWMQAHDDENHLTWEDFCKTQPGDIVYRTRRIEKHEKHYYLRQYRVV